MKNTFWIKNLLEQNKWFIIPAILVLYTSSALLMLAGIVKLYYTIINIYQNIFNPGIIEHAAKISAHFLGIIENYFLSIVFYILGLSIYKLFIGNTMPAKLGWIKVENLTDLKLHVSKMATLFLCIMFIQKVTEWGNALGTFYFGIGVAMTCAILIWYSRELENSRKR